MAVYVVTGGAGFIGSHLVEALLALGHKVRVLDNFSTGSLANLSRVMGSVDLVAGDVADAAVVRGTIDGAEAVFHMAAPVMTVGEAGDKGAVHVLRSAHAAGVRRVVMASTWLVRHRGRGESPYVAAKVAAERNCADFARDLGLETVCLRFGNVYGPRQPAESPDWQGIVSILRAMVTDQRPVIHGTGNTPQDLIYVADAVHAAVLAAEAPRVAGRVFDIGWGRPTTMLDVLAFCNAISGLQMHPVFTSNGSPGALPNQADFCRAEVELGFCPSVSLEQGLRHSIAHYASHREESLSAQPSGS